MAAVAFSLEIEKPFFSGATGFLTTIENKTDDDGGDNLIARAESYFSGQFDFSGKLFVRGEFYTISDSLFEEESTDSNSFFRIEELSATYKIIGNSSSHYLSLFKGNHESFGSDIFLQRQFGISKISSNLTESYHGLEGASIYPVYALGASWAVHTNANKVISFSLYKNKANQGPDKDNDAINFDLRFAGVFEYATIDTLAGLSFPLEKEDSESFIGINEVQFHGGVNALFGKKKSAMLYTQFGLYKIILKEKESSNNSFNLSNLYVLIEPRLPISDFYLNPSVFNFPIKTAADMIYLRSYAISNYTEENILGCNLNLVNENIYIGSSKVTIGVHGTIAMTGIDSDKLKENFSSTINDAEKTIIITPYTNIDVFGGTITASVSINTEEMNDSAKKAICGGIGFKTCF